MKERIIQETPAELEISNKRYSLIHQLYEFKTLYLDEQVQIQRQHTVSDKAVKFEFHRTSIPSYLQSDMNKNIYIEEMTEYLKKELHEGKMNKNFIELYNLEKLSESLLDYVILNKI